ncbi:MAG: hypothetical protein CMH52_04200 [Myxococcales bacterium]|nr:hypothetical protein [Myxococcales bacterium]
MQAGDTIGTYQLETRLADGVDSVWSVRHLVTGQNYQLDIHQADGSITVTNSSEMEILSSFKHENIGSILDYGIDQKHGYWTITERAQGMSLRQVLDMRGLPPQRVSVELSFIIARTVEAAHAAGFPHGHLSLASCYWDGEKLTIRDWVTPFSEADEKQAAIERDIEFLATLVTSIMAVPPAPVRSLVESRPKTSGAYRRALAASLGAMPSSTSSTLLSSPNETSSESIDDDDVDMTIETDSPLPLLPDWPTGERFNDPEQMMRTQPIDPVGKTDEHSMSIGLELWKSGVGKAQEKDSTEDAYSTVRDVKAEQADDSWGVRAPKSDLFTSTTVDHDVPTALRIHTVKSKTHNIESADRPSRGVSKTFFWIGGLLLLLGLVSVYRSHIKPGDTSVQSTDTPAVSSPKMNSKATTVQTTLAAHNERDSSLDAPTPRWFELKTHVAANVTRIVDNVVICKLEKLCKVELYPRDEKTIDTDYKISRPTYQNKIIKGYEIFDLRHKGSMRIVLAKKASR